MEEVIGNPNLIQYPPLLHQMGKIQELNNETSLTLGPVIFFLLDQITI